MIFRRHTPILITVIIIITGMIILAACTNTNKDNKATTTTAPTDGGTVTGGMFAAPAGMFNPIFHEDAYEANIIDFVYEGLVKQKKDLSYTGQLAKSWTTNKKQTEITFKLHKGITWQDGKKFTADDVVFTYQSMADPDYITVSGMHTNFVISLLGYDDYAEGKSSTFKGVTADDDYSVTFHFAKPISQPMPIASAPIIPKHIFKNIPVKDMPDASMQREKIIGTGPFQLDRADEGKKYVLKRFDHYWQGKPHLNQIVWKVIAKSSVAQQLQKEAIDMLAAPDSIQAADYKLIESFQSYTIVEQPDFSYQVLGFKQHYRTKDDVQNQLIDPENWIPHANLQETKVRQAIAYAIDRKQLLKKLLHQHGIVAHSVIPSQSFVYPGKQGDPYTFQPNKAKELLDELGYIDKDKDGYRENKNGDKWILNLDYPSGDLQRTASAKAIKDMLRKVGIHIKLRKTDDMSAYIDALENDDQQDWDMFLLGWRIDKSNPDPSLFWESRSPYNFSRWHNETADELLHKGITSPQSVKKSHRKKIYAKWQKMFMADLPALPLYTEDQIWVYHKKIHGIDILPFTMYDDSHLWWIKE